MIQINNIFPKVSLKDIQDLQDELRFKFPKSYIDHLLRFNGGVPEKAEFDFRENDGSEDGSDLRQLLGLVNEPEYASLKEQFITLKVLNKRLPKTFFPFGYDSLGNYLCMDTEEEKIYFWDHEEEVDYTKESDSVRTNLYLVSNSLSDFLNSLYEYEN